MLLFNKPQNTFEWDFPFCLSILCNIVIKTCLFQLFSSAKVNVLVEKKLNISKAQKRVYFCSNSRKGHENVTSWFILVKHKCPYNDTLESCFWNPIWLDYVRRVAPRVAQSLIPRDGSSFKAFKAFKNLKIDSRIEVPLPHLSCLPKTGSCWGWKFCGSLWIWSVWNKLRLEAPFADCRGNTIHSMGKTQTKSPFHWTDIYFFEMQHDSLLFSAVKHQWGNWIWNTNIFCYF